MLLVLVENELREELFGEFKFKAHFHLFEIKLRYDGKDLNQTGPHKKSANTSASGQPPGVQLLATGVYNYERFDYGVVTRLSAMYC